MLTLLTTRLLFTQTTQVTYPIFVRVTSANGNKLGLCDSIDFFRHMHKLFRRCLHIHCFLLNYTSLNSYPQLTCSFITFKFNILKDLGSTSSVHFVLTCVAFECREITLSICMSFHWKILCERAETKRA